MNSRRLGGANREIVSCRACVRGKGLPGENALKMSSGYCAQLGKEVAVNSKSSAAQYETTVAVLWKGRRLSFLIKRDPLNTEHLEGYDIHPIWSPDHLLGQRLEGEIESWSREERSGWAVCQHFEGAISFKNPGWSRLLAGARVSFEVSRGGNSGQEVVAVSLSRFFPNPVVKVPEVDQAEAYEVANDVACGVIGGEFVGTITSGLFAGLDSEICWIDCPVVNEKTGDTGQVLANTEDLDVQQPQAWKNVLMEGNMVSFIVEE